MRGLLRWKAGAGVLVLAGALVALGGCKKDDGGEGGSAPTPEDGCKTLAAKVVECMPKAADEGAEAVEEDCKKRADDPGFADMVTCASKDCDGFMECMKDVEKTHRKARQAKRAERRVEELKQNVADKDWKSAGKTCRIFADEAAENAEFTKLCEQASAGVTESLFKELVEMRDKLEPKEEFVKCMDLKEAAKKVSDEKAKAAEDLCEELKVASRVKKANEAVAKAIEEGKARVPYECEFAIKDLEKIDTEWAKKTLTDVKKACNEDLPKKLMTASVDALVKMRDSGDTKEGFSKCFDLKRLTKNLAKEEQDKAELLCKEVQVAGDAAKALEEAKTAAEKKDDKVPFKCTWSLDKLEKLEGSDWAKAKAKEVAKACFVDAGQHVLAAKVDKMKYVCDFNVKKVYKAVKQYELKDPAIDAHIEKASKLCEK